MARKRDEWRECPWDPTDIRLRVAGLCKSLIQARWKLEEGFLSEEHLRKWFPPDGEEVRADRNDPLAHLRMVRLTLRQLISLGFIDEQISSISPVPGPECVGQLKHFVEWLLSGELESNRFAQLEEVLRRSEEEVQSDFIQLVHWNLLPEIREALGQFPEPAPKISWVKPTWDKVNRSLQYCGKVVLKLASQASTLRKLLDQFEDQLWANETLSPFNDIGERLTHAVKSLNKKLGQDSIRFALNQSDRSVSWEPARPTPTKRKAKRAASRPSR